MEMCSKTTYSFSLTKSVNARVAVRVSEVLFVFACDLREIENSADEDKVNLNSSNASV